MKIEWGKFFRLLANLVGVGVIGFCIGWLLGMAVSPVIANVITTILGAAATLVAIMGGWQEKDAAATPLTNQPDGTPRRLIQQVANRVQLLNPWPFAMLLTLIILGSMFGLQMRSEARFGSSLSYEVKTWTDQGIPKEDVVRRLFEREHPYTPYMEPPLWLATPISVTTLVPITSAWITATSMLSLEVEMWESIGLSRTVIAERLFALKYPTIQIDKQTDTNQFSTSSSPDKVGGLVANSISMNRLTEICGFFQDESWDLLQKSLGISQVLSDTVTDLQIQNKLLSEIFQPLCPETPTPANQ